ncbi:hypothetical protein [Thermomonas paludicola]|nr:hypothetical protein [Thermomonas paludicola]
MAKPRQSKPNACKRALDPTPRHLWLAVLGVLAAARRRLLRGR